MKNKLEHSLLRLLSLASRPELLVLLLIIVIALGKYRADYGDWLPLAAFFFGLSIASFLIARASENALAGFSDIRQRSGTSSGYSPLDKLLKEFSGKVLNLLKNIEEIGGETQGLISKYEVLTDNIAASIVVRDKKGKVVYCSPYTEVLTGYALDDIYASKQDFFMSIAHPEDKENYRRALSVSSLGEAFQFRYRIYHQSGMEIWVETRTVPLTDDEGDVSSTISITLDVAATVRYQKQVEDQNRDLQDFSYMVSHDLKAPVHTIKGMVNMLKDVPSSEESRISMPEGSAPEFEVTLGHMSKAVQKLEELIAAVLEYSRISKKDNSYEEIRLKELLEDVVSDYRGEIQKRGAIIEIDDELPAISSDRIKLYQIFSNLVGNSLKYSAPERNPHIKVRHESRKRIIGVDRNKGELLISIEDNGLGIAEEKKELIFRPFQRAHADLNVPGSGIGLSCVKKLLDHLGGEISVESKEGKGSTFTVMLPRM